MNSSSYGRSAKERNGIDVVLVDTQVDVYTMQVAVHEHRSKTILRPLRSGRHF